MSSFLNVLNQTNKIDQPNVLYHLTARMIMVIVILLKSLCYCKIAQNHHSYILNPREEISALNCSVIGIDQVKPDAALMH